MNKDEWLKERRKYLTASDVAAVLGLSKYKTPEQVWLEKTGKVTDEIEDNDFMRDGRDLEPMVAARYQEETGRELKANLYELHPCPKNSFLAATPDYLTDKGLVQIKTMDALRFADFCEKPPVQYVVQCLVELVCTEREVNDLFGWAYGRGTKLHVIERDDQSEQAILDTCSSWWQAHVVEGVPPLSEQSDPKDVAAIFNKGDAGEIILPDDADGLIEMYILYSEIIKDYEEKKRSTQSRLMQLMGEASRGQANAGHITWSRGTRTTVDTKKLKTQFKEIYEQCKTESPNSAFRIWPKKEQ
jgi:putative phage-type endonuclease